MRHPRADCDAQHIAETVDSPLMQGPSGQAPKRFVTCSCYPVDGSLGYGTTSGLDSAEPPTL
jgi:hypothetical protein